MQGRDRTFGIGPRGSRWHGDAHALMEGPAGYVSRGREFWRDSKPLCPCDIFPLWLDVETGRDNYVRPLLPQASPGGPTVAYWAASITAPSSMVRTCPSFITQSPSTITDSTSLAWA